MVVLKQEHINDIVKHAKGEAPFEACGILAGVDSRVVKGYRVTNAERSRVRYTMDPKEQLKVMKEIDDRGWELLGIYHSHPASPAYPSPTDISLAFYPDSIYFLVSLMDPQKPVLRGYRILDGRVHEEEIRVED